MMETMGEAMVTVMRCESDETRARLAATLHRDGMRPVLVHCATSASADAVVSLLALRPDAPTVRRSPDAESVADFKAAIAAAPDTIHVYYEQVCDVCGALPPLFHTSVRAGFFCRPCAEAIICGGDTKIAGRA